MLNSFYLLPIVGVAISLCDFDIQKMGKDWIKIINPVQLFTHLGSSHSCKISINITGNLDVFILLEYQPMVFGLF
jgi:hypothetical protein